MADKLSIYNSVLSEKIGERKLFSLSENRPERHALDSAWDGGAPKLVLENGQWNSAIRTIESIYDPDYSPSFGYSRIHTKPDDWVRTVGLSTSENVSPPLMDYQDESGHWLCDYDVLYIRYVSSNIYFGGDLSKWPQSMIEYLVCEIAAKVAMSITGDKDLARLLRAEADQARKLSKSIDQMNQAPVSPPMGSWATSRLVGNRHADQGYISGSIGTTGSNYQGDPDVDIPVVGSGKDFSDAFSSAFS